jgi:glycosyltransferase involved in cell wall biosynthesis
MKILFIHQNFPAQFKGLAATLAADPKNEVIALRLGKQIEFSGVRVIPYGLLHKPEPKTHSLLQEAESKILRAEAVAAIAIGLRADGFMPDVVISHSGWGEPMLLKEIWPEAKYVNYFEYFYNRAGQDFNFDPEFQDDRLSSLAKLKLKNVPNLLAMQEVDLGITPTRWQRDTYPIWFRDKIQVLHEGVDTEFFSPNPKSEITIANKGVTLKAGDEVITFAARYLEPVRGFHIFMRALPQLLRKHPKAHIVIMGDPKAGYGPPPTNKSYATFKDQLLAEVGSELDPKRVHFVGWLPIEQYRAFLQISRVHVYLTAPFLISWSLLEAMATGPLIVASDTPPVQEFVRDKTDGLLFDFFDSNALEKTVNRALRMAVKERRAIQASARKRIVNTHTSEKLIAELIGAIRAMVGLKKQILNTEKLIAKKTITRTLTSKKKVPANQSSQQTVRKSSKTKTIEVKQVTVSASSKKNSTARTNKKVKRSGT